MTRSGAPTGVGECGPAPSVEPGLPGLRPHDLRHTAASLAIASGASVKHVQRMLGHKDSAMTLNVYASLFEDDLEDLSERLDQALSLAAAASVRPERSGKDTRPGWSTAEGGSTRVLCAPSRIRTCDKV